MNTKTAGFGSYLWNATKATLLGGLAFLLPLVVVLIILGKAMTFSAHVMEPVTKHLPPTPLTVSLVGVASLVALIVVSLLAGLVAHPLTLSSNLATSIPTPPTHDVARDRGH